MKKYAQLIMAVLAVLLWLILPGRDTIVAMMSPHSFWKNTFATFCCIVILNLLCLQPDYAKKKFVGLVMIGFVFSILGDLFMNLSGENRFLFLCALGAFLTMHVFFILAFLSNGRFRWGSIITCIALLAFYLPYYFFVVARSPEVTSLMAGLPFLAYLVASVVSVSASVGLRFPFWIRIVAITGMAMVLLSDTLISQRIFAKSDAFGYLIIPTYVLMHFLLTASIVLDWAYRRYEISALPEY
ncbi:MAG: lysoplasmalogenase family protein [Planctomycetia bacterium]|nr:lysoplasmalogenase family protein [Planctomycetia bacterium]